MESSIHDWQLWASALIEWGRGKMAAIIQTTLSFKWFFLCSNYTIWIQISLPQWKYARINSDDGLVPNRQRAIIWTNDGAVYLRIYESLGPNELNRGCDILYI